MAEQILAQVFADFSVVAYVAEVAGIATQGRDQARLNRLEIDKSVLRAPQGRPIRQW